MTAEQGRRIPYRDTLNDHPDAARWRLREWRRAWAANADEIDQLTGLPLLADPLTLDETAGADQPPTARGLRRLVALLGLGHGLWHR